MEQTIENNPSGDSQVAGATTGEQSQEATGNSTATSEPILGKFKSTEDLINAYKELENHQTELGAQANRGERYDKLVANLVQTTGRPQYEIEALLEQELTNPAIAPAQQGQTPDPTTRKMAEMERKMDWQEVSAKSPELSAFRDQILDYANAKNISVLDAVKALRPIFDSGKEAAQTKKEVKQEASVPSSNASASTTGSLDRQIQDKTILIQKIKAGEAPGSPEQVMVELLGLKEQKRLQEEG